MATKTKSKKTKKRTLAQRAGKFRAKLTREGVEYLEDHKGQKVPVAYVPPIDMLKHFACEELMADAQELVEALARFKGKCQQMGDELYEQLMAEEEIREKSVGGFRLNNFDKSKYIDFKMDTVQVVDSEQLAIAKEYKDRFIKEEAGEMSNVISELLNLAFETSDGNIDPRRGRALNKYRSRIKNKNFHKFLDHYNQAFDINHTKRYERFLYRDEQGEEQSIVLSYTKVDPKLPSEYE
nr:hypothetical protein 11 [Balneolaceae bacterium]